MRLYRRTRWNIVTKVGALLLFSAFSCQSAWAVLESADFEWYREAARDAMRQQTLPPAEVTSVSVHENHLTAQINVRPEFTGNSIDLTLAAPAGEITSAALTGYESARGESETKSGITTGTVAVADYESAQRVVAKHLGFIRGHRLVKVQISAILPGAAGARLKSGTLTISYKEPIADTVDGSDNGVSLLNPLDEMVAQLVANPEDIGKFALPLEQAPDPTEDEGSPPLGIHGTSVARFETTGEGFVRFTGADLAGVGVNLTKTDVSRVTVWSNGEQQWLLYETDESRPVKPEDEFTLYSQENQSTYTASRVYWIRTDLTALESSLDMHPVAESSAPVAKTQHFMAHRTVQQDTPPVLTTNDQFLTILGYRWVWWTWTPTGSGSGLPQPRSYDQPGEIGFDLPGLSDAKASTTLTFNFYVHLWGKESVPVPFDLQVNGKPLGQIEVSETSGLEQKVSVPSDLLNAGSNQITLTPRVTTDTKSLPELCFDRLEVTYPRAYIFSSERDRSAGPSHPMTSRTLEFTPPSDVGGVITVSVDNQSSTVLVADVSTTNPQIHRLPVVNSKLIITTQGPISRRYVAAIPAGVNHVTLNKVEQKNDLRSPDNRADVVVIAAPEFIKDLEPWVERKVSKGYAVKVVDVHDIYDQFGFGHLSPHAIRAFLRYAAIHWQGSDAGSAASVVLLVGDSTSAYRNEFRNDVINYVPTMRTSAGSDIFASDQWYVSLFGNDAFADAIVGRFSVNSTEDLRNLLSKQLDYESASAPGSWQNTLGFIADHSEFEESVDRIMKQVVPPRFFLDRIMMSELPWIDNYYFPEEVAEAQKAKVSPVATGRIRDMFNKGAAVVTYFGHGSPNIWSTERMWFGGDSPNSDNLLLTNRDRLSIVINMTCNSGAIDYPQPRWDVNISEDFMRVPNGGAVACFVPSGPGLTVQHERLMMEVGRELFGEDMRPLGQSLQLALWRYLAAGNPEDLARMYILLGDPLLIPRISKPASPRGAADKQVTQWPGTIILPPDTTGIDGGGSFQMHHYGAHIDSKRIQAYTSATVALPLPEFLPDLAQALSLSLRDTRTTAARSVSTFVPVVILPALKVLQWDRVDNAVDGDATATLKVRLRNNSPIPLRGIHLRLLSEVTGEVAAVSSPTDFLPLADGDIMLDVPTVPGLTPLRVEVSDGTAHRAVETAVPVAVAGIRPENMRDKLAPAVVDGRSVVISNRGTTAHVTAAITAHVYMIAQEPLSNLRVGLENAAGVVAQDSIANVPPTGPGERARISVAASLQSGATSETFHLRFDPAGFYPEFARHPAYPIILGSGTFPDLAVMSVVPSNNSPTDGETVFFDVTVENKGAAQADGIRVEGFRNLGGDNREKLDSQATLPNPLLNLEPGSSETMRLRWDPFRNAGKNELIFTAASTSEIPDRQLDNNEKVLTVTARTKANLHTVRAGVLPLSRQDAATTQVRMLARLRNDGQTDAHGLRVLFYSSPSKLPETYLGETELTTVPAGKTTDAIFVYKLKPDELKKPFNVTFDVMYKGSRQRLPLN